MIEYWFDATVSGACCNTSGGSCLQLTATGCAAATNALYRGDGTACLGDTNSNGYDDACDDLFPIPAVSTWGLVVLTLLTITTGTLILRSARTATLSAGR